MRMTICTIFLLIHTLSFSQENASISKQVDKASLPIPKEKNQLFYLQRDPDENTVVYVLNMEDGEINSSNPVHAYWIRYAGSGKVEKLSFFQRKMAYGIHHKEIEDDIYELYIQAYKALKINLVPDLQTGRHHALVNVKGKNVILQRIFVRINGGTFLKPHVEYVEISGRLLKNGQKANFKIDL